MWCGIVPFVFMSHFYFVLSVPIKTEDENKSLGEKTSDSDTDHNFIMLQPNGQDENKEIRKKRVKRQSSGKFAEAAEMTELKSLRVFLQMFKNTWASSHIGGSHPLHRDVPKPVVLLFKQRVMEFFFPPVGQDAMKD